MASGEIDIENSPAAEAVELKLIDGIDTINQNIVKIDLSLSPAMETVNSYEERSLTTGITKETLCWNDSYETKGFELLQKLHFQNTV